MNADETRSELAELHRIEAYRISGLIDRGAAEIQCCPMTANWKSLNSLTAVENQAGRRLLVESGYPIG